MPLFKAPNPETFTAEHPDTGAQLFTWLRPGNPFYPVVRVVFPPDRPKRSYWLTWGIDEGRLVRSRVAETLPDVVRPWVDACLREEYPNAQAVHGWTPEEEEEERAAFKAGIAKRKAERQRNA